jgi:hypothetical protein
VLYAIVAVHGIDLPNKVLIRRTPSHAVSKRQQAKKAHTSKSIPTLQYLLNIFTLMETEHHTNGYDITSPMGDIVYDQKPIIPSSHNKENQERVKGKWGDELNTAFQYEKYVGDKPSFGNWASSAARYEWQEQFDGEAIAPRDESLEKELFGDEGEGNMGINFAK